MTIFTVAHALATAKYGSSGVGTYTSIHWLWTKGKALLTKTEATAQTDLTAVEKTL